MIRYRFFLLFSRNRLALFAVHVAAVTVRHGVCEVREPMVGHFRVRHLWVGIHVDLLVRYREPVAVALLSAIAAIDTGWSD